MGNGVNEYNMYKFSTCAEQAAALSTGPETDLRAGNRKWNEPRQQFQECDSN